MRWFYLAAVLLSVFVLQADMPQWVIVLAVIAFFANLIMFLIAIDEDLHDV